MAKEEMPEEVKAYFKRLTSKAGKASAKKLTPTQRKKKATRAANARWKLKAGFSGKSGLTRPRNPLPRNPKPKQK